MLGLSGAYWSRTADSTSARIVDFSDGRVVAHVKSGTFYVRVVREVQLQDGRAW